MRSSSEENLVLCAVASEAQHMSRQAMNKWRMGEVPMMSR